MKRCRRFVGFVRSWDFTRNMSGIREGDVIIKGGMDTIREKVSE